MATEQPFRFGPAELFVGCDLGDADALALDEEEGVKGYKSLGPARVETHIDFELPTSQEEA